MIVINNCRLWVACGTRIHVISCTTLDTVDRLTPMTLSSCSLDDGAVQTITTTSNSTAVWISLRGSSTLELWDVDTVTCTMLFDLATSASSSIRVGLTVSLSVTS